MTTEQQARHHLEFAEIALDEGNTQLALVYAQCGHAYALLAAQERLSLAQITMPGLGGNPR